MSPTFKRGLMGVFYSAMLLDCNQVMSFLEASQFLGEFFQISTEILSKMRLSYERKLYALAMSELLFNCNNLPTFV